VSCVKTIASIEMPFGIFTRVGPRNHVLDGVQIAPCEYAIFRGKDMPGHARRHSAVSSAKMAESIEMPFGLWTLSGGPMEALHGGAHWRHLANTIEPSMFVGPAKSDRYAVWVVDSGGPRSMY